ncbi:MAG: 50S ribosomal protein L5 [Candidatus Pacebacteria bacterium]|nr:50S ribosomal protein L5 [Candidatus Paceibacterota bacterium]PIR64044.1 MAG: 50S ribosomal protein L5 [Candidatus Pacebacteria bacterium CG10_big_fil_rev_8_21_14_0_10_40_26]PIZ78148.1 MAG: 50S ribosomal protein L5 [Candidatus Pacebacteria bacterium CG_4_10_14_0_2_um_filter_40_20]PJA69120.1 MAG: 50S ribosomal protein L5 [Candidatus Pacebacteria bacterium CG_4_9_14_3_um_filter_40_12]PJC41747.1 MAG: 50S ribosomal protein L5 [Candidatus Pacebacteria bacterium CG_4_9_14_0_2_um_filter_40_15]
MSDLKTTYQQELVPQLEKEFGIDNVFAVPHLQKVVLNIGVTNPVDPRARKPILENIVTQFETITGQKPQITLAKKSIAGFKLREGDPMGVMVTLRGQRMWDFVTKLISIALPRVKDFRGVSRVAFDGQGNYSLGIEEQIIFPEINYDSIENVRSLQINFVTTAETDEQAFRLLELLGMPFEKEESK